MTAVCQGTRFSHIERPNTRLQATGLRAALAVLGLTRFGRRLNRHVRPLKLPTNAGTRQALYNQINLPRQNKGHKLAQMWLYHAGGVKRSG